MCHGVSIWTPPRVHLGVIYYFSFPIVTKIAYSTKRNEHYSEIFIVLDKIRYLYRKRYNQGTYIKEVTSE